MFSCEHENRDAQEKVPNSEIEQTQDVRDGNIIVQFIGEFGRVR